MNEVLGLAVNSNTSMQSFSRCGAFKKRCPFVYACSFCSGDFHKCYLVVPAAKAVCIYERASLLKASLWEKDFKLVLPLTPRPKTSFI